MLSLSRSVRPDPPAKAEFRRRRHYVDATIQLRLLATLLILEFLLAAGAILYLYFDFATAIDGNIYRIHVPDQQGAVPDLLGRLGAMIIVVVVVNLLMVVVADRLWARYLDRILRRIHLLFAKTTALDFTPDPVVDGHEALLIATEWRQSEREHMTHICHLIDTIDPYTDFNDPIVTGAFRASLAELLAALRQGEDDGVRHEQ